jgi:hypothetical protein
VLLHDGVKPGPEVITIATATRRRVTGGKLRRFALQHEAVDCSEKAESKS